MNTSKGLMAAALLTATCAAQADWNLDAQRSNIHAVSIKKTSVAESHAFEKLSGKIDADGQLRVDIDLASIESMIPIRNQRLRDLLFETVKFPTATVTGQLELSQIAQLQVGERLPLTTAFTLDLHGHSQTAQANVLLQKMSNGAIQLITQQPIIIKAADFGLVDGIQQLQSLAKLSSIATAIPVSAQVTFTAE